MLTGKTTPVRSHLNLLPLREALTAAGSAVPPQPVRVDSNEQRALQLIARLRTEYKKMNPFLNLHDIPNPQGVHVSAAILSNIHSGQS